MAKGQNQKLKILYLLRFLMENTDENHPLTMAQLLEMLEEADVSAERKSVYDDLEALRQFGVDVETTQSRSTGYYIGERQFEMPELKLLVDAVQSSKFITTKKSVQLIRKIERLASRHEATQLQRQVFVQNRIKTMNESIYYNVDLIHAAISGNRQIRFHYFNWNVQGERILRRNGAFYTASPWALTWDDENYYMVAFDSETHGIRHYRVDKMLHIETLTVPREGEDVFHQFDTAIYSKKIFGMYGGEEKHVTLRCDASLAGVIIDRFGRDTVRIAEGDTFTVTVRVFERRTFLSWVMGFGSRMEIVQPASTRAAAAALADEIMQMYRKESNA